MNTKLRPEYQKILDALTWAYPINGRISAHHHFDMAIERCQALQDKPRRMLSDEAIFAQAKLTLGKMTHRGFNALEIIDFAHAVIAAEQALQLEPVMQKVTVRIYRHTDGEILSISRDSAELKPSYGWTLIDTIEKDYPV